MSQVSLDIISRDYLWDYSPSEALILASNRLEEVIPWLLVEAKDNSLYFSHGEKGVFAVLPIPQQNLDALAELKAIENTIAESGYNISDSVELDIELLRGYMDALDRYSSVMYKESLTRFTERIQGQLTGIGCRVQKVDEGIRITEVFPDSPAERGGIIKNNIITHIDGSSIKGISLNEAVDRLRGLEDSYVDIRILQDGEERDVSLQRAVVRIPNVRLYMESNIAQIVIENFSSQTLRGVNKALSTIRKNTDIQGIILDLRGNTGGSMWQSCKTVDAFLKEGLVLKTEGRNGKSIARLMRMYEAEEDRELDLPMIVLINHRSASASEIVAGALQLHKRALLIGQRTHGKGVVQMPHTVRKNPEPVKIKLTVAQYILESGFSVHDAKGITPDIWLERYVFSEEGFSHDRKASEYDGIRFLYAEEKSGWRVGGNIREDYPLSFARELLLATKGHLVSDIQEAAKSVIPKKQEEEKRLIEELFAAKELNWSETGERILDLIEVSPLRVQKISTGTPYEWEIEIYNPTEYSIPQVYASLSANSEYMPWFDEQIPVGTLQPKERKKIRLKGEIPIGLSGSLEEFGMALQSGDVVRSVYSLPIEIVEQSVPRLLVRSQIEEGDPLQLKLSVENLSDRDVRELAVRLSLPNIKDVEILNEASYEKELLEKGDVVDVQYSFRSALKLEDIPELKLMVQVEHRSSKLEFIEKPINLIAEQLLLAPVIHTLIPIQSKAGKMNVEVKLEDDGAIVDSSIWVDGEKKGWRGESLFWSTSLELSSGKHRIDIEATDEQGLETRSIYYVDIPVE